MAGRRPKPLEIHRLNNNPSMMNKKELSGEDNPQPSKETPERPRGLGKGGKREWNRIVPELQKIGVLSSIDGKALMGYCVAYQYWEQADKLITKYGQLIEVTFQDKQGNLVVGDLKANPACGLADKWLARMKSFLIEFGLTPASRRNLKIAKKDEGDAMDQFLKRERPQGGPALLEPVAPEDMTVEDVAPEPEEEESGE